MLVLSETCELRSEWQCAAQLLARDRDRAGANYSNRSAGIR